VWGKAQNNDVMILCESYKREGSMAVVAIEDEEAIVTGVVQAGGRRRCKILF
jgi:hypothetical protein